MDITVAMARMLRPISGAAVIAPSLTTIRTKATQTPTLENVAAVVTKATQRLPISTERRIRAVVTVTLATEL